MPATILINAILSKAKQDEDSKKKVWNVRFEQCYLPTFSRIHNKIMTVVYIVYKWQDGG